MRWNVHQDRLNQEMHFEICLNDSDVRRFQELGLDRIENIDLETFIRYMIYISEHFGKGTIKPI
jgi:hypothetical protein